MAGVGHRGSSNEGAGAMTLQDPGKLGGYVLEVGAWFLVCLVLVWFGFSLVFFGCYVFFVPWVMFFSH